MTAEDSLTLQVADALLASGLPYVLAGSFASNYYGIPRSTNDADFVLQLQGGVGSEFAAILGRDFELDPQLSFETVTGTYRQYVRHRKTSFEIEPLMLSMDPLDQERLSRRREHNLFGRKVWLLSPEDVVVSKLRWARSTTGQTGLALHPEMVSQTRQACYNGRNPAFCSGCLKP